MYIYYNNTNDEVFAVAEKPVISIPLETISMVEYNGELPKPIKHYFFNPEQGFYKRDELSLLILEQEHTNEAAKQFLTKTDWYVIRKLEEGTKIPKEIADARRGARAKILSRDEIIEWYEKELEDQEEDKESE